MFIKIPKNGKSTKIALAVSLYRGVLFKGYRLLKNAVLRFIRFRLR